MPTPPNRRRSPVSPCTNRSKMRSWSPTAMPMPSSSTSTSIIGPTIRARTMTVPPDGAYLKAFSSSWPTMMSVAIASPYASGRSAGTSATTSCLSESGPNETTVARSSAARSNEAFLTGSASAAERELLQEPAERAGPLGDGPDGRPAVGVGELLPPARQGRGEPLHHGDRRAQLVAGGGQGQVLGLLELLRGGDVAEVDDLLAAVAELGAEHVDPPAARQLVGTPLARRRQRERRRGTHHLGRRGAGDPMRGRVPLPDVPALIEHRDAVGAAVDDGPLVGALLDDLFERHRVGQRHAGVPGQELEQFKLDVAERAAGVG